MKDIAPDFPFESHFLSVRGSRMHYLDEGDGEPMLLLHGNPTSSYLWRKIIPFLTPFARVIAPDLIGMGRSGKPEIDYRFFDHLAYLEEFIRRLGLERVTLVMHDWGSALGFHYARRNESNVRALAFMEAILGPISSWGRMPENFLRIFKRFRTPEVGWDLIVNQNYFVERVLPGSVVHELTEEEMGQYRRPFEDPASRVPVWR